MIDEAFNKDDFTKQINFFKHRNEALIKRFNIYNQEVGNMLSKFLVFHIKTL
jgi:hypothetical protein